MKALISVLLILASTGALAQGAAIPFASLAPGDAESVEVTADQLEVNQSTGRAIFSGNVLVGFGEMRLSAARMEVLYDTEAGEQGPVSLLLAEGGVTFTNGLEAAESRTAELDLRGGTLKMNGDIILTQGANILSGQALFVDLNAGTARMEGRVQTILQTGVGE